MFSSASDHGNQTQHMTPVDLQPESLPRRKKLQMLWTRTHGSIASEGSCVHLSLLLRLLGGLLGDHILLEDSTKQSY